MTLDLAPALIRYVGIPYRDKGTNPATGLDCWQLVRLFYQEQFGVELPGYLALYDSSLDRSDCEQAILRALPQWAPVDPPLFGDVLVFRIVTGPWHTAVQLDDGLMLHTDQGHGSVIEPAKGIRWRDRHYGAYRWKS